MKEITLKDNRGFFVRGYDENYYSSTKSAVYALKFSSLADARKMEKEINQSYGFKKVQVTFT